MKAKITVDNFAMKRCKGCKECTGGVENVGRKIVLWTLVFCTIGIALPFMKKCTTCGHYKFLNAHDDE